MNLNLPKSDAIAAIKLLWWGGRTGSAWAESSYEDRAVYRQRYEKSLALAKSAPGDRVPYDVTPTVKHFVNAALWRWPLWSLGLAALVAGVGGLYVGGSQVLDHSFARDDVYQLVEYYFIHPGAVVACLLALPVVFFAALLMRGYIRVLRLAMHVRRVKKDPSYLLIEEELF